MLPPLLTAGAGSSIPISAGGGTSGPATSGFSGSQPINIGGLFGGTATSSDNKFPLLIIGGIVLAGFVLLLRR